MDTTNTNINAIDAAACVENSMHENDDVIAQPEEAIAMHTFKKWFLHADEFARA